MSSTDLQQSTPASPVSPIAETGDSRIDAAAFHTEGTVPASLATPQRYTVDPKNPPRIDRAEMLRYLGYAGQELDPELVQRIDATIDEIEGTIHPRGIRRVFAVDAANRDTDGKPCIRLCGSAIELRGRDIYRHLKDARYCAIFACTLGMRSEQRLRLLASQNPLDGALYDAGCSAFVEAAVEQMDRAVKLQARLLEMRGNWRFSPGYGDCPLTCQPQVIAGLDATRICGITVTQTNLLMPTKSVTACIGLFEGAVRSSNSRPTCSICRMRPTCAFRARGETCYGAPVSL